MPKTLQRGRIDITDNYEMVYEILRDQGSNVFVVDIDEENDPNIHRNHPRVIGGSCLIPPMEALIAAADGEADVFRMMYAEHFSTPFIDNYVAALIIHIFGDGGNLLLYYHDELGIVPELIQIFWMRYGIQIGIVGESDCFMDPSCIPIWLQYLYKENKFTGRDFLYNYPVKTPINGAMMNKLILEILPPGNKAEQEQEIYRMVALLKQCPNLINPLIGGMMVE